MNKKGSPAGDDSYETVLGRWIADHGEEKRLDYPLDDNSVVFDIGAHVGDWAEDINRLYDCRMHLFEPIDEHVMALKERFADNPKVMVHDCAIWDRDGSQTIFLRGTGSSWYGGDGATETIRTRCAAGIIDELGLSHIDLAKINVEGAEFDLLEHLLEHRLVGMFDNLQIQFHDIFPEAKMRREQIRARLSTTHEPTYDYPFVWENWQRRTNTVSTGHSMIDRDTARGLLADGWQHDDVAESQERAFSDLIRAMQSGDIREDFKVAAQSVAEAGLTRPSLLEVGCGSGYYADVLKYLVGEEIEYTGLDSSRSMIDLARRLRPQSTFVSGDAARLPFADDRFDIVMNGVSLMHTIDYPHVIAESRRVARSCCIFHTVPVMARRPTTYLKKTAYGHEVIEIIFNEAELLELFRLNGLNVRRAVESIPYDLSALIGEPTPTRTYLLAQEEGGMAALDLRLVNVGCGRRVHPQWLNFDVKPSMPGVQPHNLMEPLPIADVSCDLVYNSHVLEHLPRWQAPALIAECYRILRPGGILRVVVPDLQTICRLYLENLTGAMHGDRVAAQRYEWMLMELLDQMVREESGGDMLRYWMRDPMPAADFVFTRVGQEAHEVIARNRGGKSGDAVRIRPPAEELGRFRRSGEVHLWMYDRYSLEQLFKQAGFFGIRRCEADESYMHGFSEFSLDTLADGTVRKPDSLFMEAIRPSDASVHASKVRAGQP